MSQAQPSALTGSWVLAPEAALKVGPAAEWRLVVQFRR